jgi:hypothetical protein
MHAHKCPDFDYGVVKAGDPAMEFCLCAPISETHAHLASKPCEVGPCSVCDGMDHHWMPDCDEDNGQPMMKCKHCDARREYTDEDE